MVARPARFSVRARLLGAPSVRRRRLQRARHPRWPPGSTAPRLPQRWQPCGWSVHSFEGPVIPLRRPAQRLRRLFCAPPLLHKDMLPLAERPFAGTGASGVSPAQIRRRRHRIRRRRHRQLVHKTGAVVPGTNSPVLCPRGRYQDSHNCLTALHLAERLTWLTPASTREDERARNQCLSRPLRGAAPHRAPPPDPGSPP